MVGLEGYFARLTAKDGLTLLLNLAPVVLFIQVILLFYLFDFYYLREKVVVCLL